MHEVTCMSNMIIRSLLIIQFRRNSYYKHGYSSEVETLVNKQIQAEQQAAHNYLSMATTFLHPSISRPGTGGFFMRMYHEELKHAEEFIHYQLCRGGCHLVKELCAPTPNSKITIINAFQQALILEHEVTKLLENLISVAESAKDYHCVNFITSVFMEDQINCINMLAGHLTEIARFCNNEDALWDYDLHLAATYPYKYKSLRK